MIPSSFSIDYLARKERGRDSVRHNSSGSDDSCRRSPSPSSSMSSNGNDTENPQTIAQLLPSLDKTIKSTSNVSSMAKPPDSYIALISMAILTSVEKRMLLCDIYQYIMDNFTYYNNKNKSWRNSIRHNLSLNECFVKSGRAENCKGHYWSVHPACVEDFSRGDFRRRQARRRARKSSKDINALNLGMKGILNSVGYVPMTSSSVGYHPYSQPSPYMLPYSYPQAGINECSMSPPARSSSTSFFQPSPSPSPSSTTSFLQPSPSPSSSSTMQFFPPSSSSTTSFFQPSSTTTTSFFQPASSELHHLRHPSLTTQNVYGW